MIDLTPHLSTAERQQLGPLFMSDRAAEHLRGALRAHYQSPQSEPQHFAPTVAKSVVSFLTSDYFKASAWFRGQRVHVCAAFTFTSANRQHAPLVHVVSSSRGLTVVTPGEHALPETYFERRVIEEVRIECGLVDKAPQENGGAR